MRRAALSNLQRALTSMTRPEFHSYLEGPAVGCLISTVLLVKGRAEA